LCCTIKNNILQFLSQYYLIFCCVSADNEALNAVVTSKGKLVRTIFWTLRLIGQKGKEFLSFATVYLPLTPFSFQTPIQVLTTVLVSQLM
jgi:hypothetical protein